MNYLPNLLARRFGYFSNFSIFGVWCSLLSAMIALVIAIPIVASVSNLLVAPTAGLFVLFFAGVISAKFYARRPIIMTEPIAVKFAASNAGDKVTKAGGTLVEIIFSLFIHFVLIQFIILCLVPFIAVATT